MLIIINAFSCLVINAENAAHKSQKFTAMAVRTRFEYLKDLGTNFVSATTIDSGGAKFSKLPHSCCLLIWTQAKEINYMQCDYIKMHQLLLLLICWHTIIIIYEYLHEDKHFIEQFILL